jgi:hypothetical protein
MSSGNLNTGTRERAPRRSLFNPPQCIASTTFTDHTGKSATSAWYGDSSQPGAPILPPIWSFHYYVTFGATAETASTLPQDLVKATKRPLSEVPPFRLDIYFLPGASTENCTQHYRHEKASRQHASPPRNFIDPYSNAYSQFKIFVQIEAADWEEAGATLVFFEITSRYDDEGTPPSTHIDRNRPWGDQEDFVNSVGASLKQIAGDIGRDDMTEAYENRLSGGHYDWT